MHSFVDFQVDWPMLLFRSRPQIPCRDINLLSRHQLMSSAALNLFVPDVVTSIPCRDFTLCLCNFQLVVHDVVTSISCRDINLRNCNLQLSMSIVTTSISCRDINLCLWRLHLVVFGVATSVFCHDNSLSHISFIFSNLS